MRTVVAGGFDLAVVGQVGDRLGEALFEGAPGVAGGGVGAEVVAEQ